MIVDSMVYPEAQRRRGILLHPSTQGKIGKIYHGATGYGDT